MNTELATRVSSGDSREGDTVEVTVNVVIKEGGDIFKANAWEDPACWVRWGWDLGHMISKPVTLGHRTYHSAAPVSIKE